MAGTPTAYFFYLVTLPTLVVLFFSSLIQAWMKSQNYLKYLKINCIIAIVPFLLAPRVRIVVTPKI